MTRGSLGPAAKRVGYSADRHDPGVADVKIQGRPKTKKKEAEVGGNAGDRAFSRIGRRGLSCRFHVKDGGAGGTTSFF